MPDFEELSIHPAAPEGFEQLMLRLWARHVADLCRRAGQPAPPGVTTILGDYTPVRRANDSCAFEAWCFHHGLEFPVIDGQTGELCALRNPEDFPLVHYDEWGRDWKPPHTRPA